MEARQGDDLTKPDRIERVVAKAVENEPEERDYKKAIGYYLRDRTVIALLRREAAYQRALVRRIVKAQRPKGHDRIVSNREEISCNMEKCYWLACDDLLAALTPRRTR